MLSCTPSWHTYRLLVMMHEVPDLGSKTGGIRRLDRYDQLAEYVFGKRVLNENELENGILRGLLAA